MSKRNSNVVRVKGGIGPRKAGKVTYRMAAKNGRMVKLRMLDADSADFTAQLTDAFRSSVRKAREENRLLVEPG